MSAMKLRPLSGCKTTRVSRSPAADAAGTMSRASMFVSRTVAWMHSGTSLRRTLCLPPTTLYPNATNAERRYFCCTAIAELFGGKKSRFKIPECLEMAIEELYPRPRHVAPVGFKAN